MDYSIPKELEEDIFFNDKEFAIDALVNLGYVKNEVEKVISNIDYNNLQLEEIIKMAMKTLESKR